MKMKDLQKDERTYCPKCGAVLGENTDGKPMCWCGVWPGNEIDSFIPIVHKPGFVKPLTPERQREFGGCG